MPDEKRFTKQNAKDVLEEVDELFSALPKTKQGSYLGHLNDICLFLEAVQRIAPEGK